MTANLGSFLLATVSLALIIGGAFLTWRDVKSKRIAQSGSTVDPRVAAVAVTRSDRSLATSADSTRATTVPLAIAGAAPDITLSDTRSTRRIAVPPTRRSDNAATEHESGITAVTIVKRELQAAKVEMAASGGVAAAVPGQSFGEMRAAIAAILSETNETSDTDAESQRWPSVEARFVHIEREMDRAVASLNTALAPVLLNVGKSGEVGWSFKNRGYGSYRRIAIGERSIGWLRAETNQEHQLICKVRAHSADYALLNASAQISATRLDDTQMIDLLAKVLRPAAEYAAWIAPRDRANPVGAADEGWGEIAPRARDAFMIANGALREAEAALSETSAPAWDAETGVHRWRLAVAVGPQRVVDITVSMIKRSLEVVSQPADTARTDLARKRRLDVDHLDAHALAEAIAATAWPAVADRLERTPP